MGAMRITIRENMLKLVMGDITEQEADGIVNAANAHLAGGGGVDGAIHRAAGPSLMQELKRRYPGGCPTGGAVITGAGRLPARYIIHAVGPRYSGNPQDAEKLASAYAASLQLAHEYRCRSIVFPSISTGAYGYPLDEAAPIALGTVARILQTHGGIEDVRFVLFDDAAFDAYQRALDALNS